MNYKLLAADIDGTLLNSKGQLTDRTISAVKKLIDKGFMFVLSTGRPYQGITKFINALGLENMPYILYNGAMIMEGGETIYSLTLQEDIATKIVEEGHKRNSTQICWANNQLYSEFDSEKVQFYKAISGVEPVIVENLAEVSKLGITKLVWYDDPASTAMYHEQMQTLMGNVVNVHPSRIDFLEFVNKECSKAVALNIIAEKFNIDISQTVAIGDGFNDLPMLTAAGLGVAMGNANDKVKTKCKMVCCSCDDDGLARFIEDYLL